MQVKKSVNPFQGPNYHKFASMKDQLEKQNAALLKERSRLQSENEVYRNTPSQNTIIERNQFSIRQEDQENNELPYFEPALDQRHLNNRSTNKSAKNRSMKEEAYDKGHMLSDDVIEMIEQIENKALTQIESLRVDKISLMKRLNKEIKINNQNSQQQIRPASKHRQRRSNIPSQAKISRQDIPVPIQQEDSEQLSASNKKYRDSQEYIQHNPQYNENENSQYSQNRHRNGNEGNRPQGKINYQQSYLQQQKSRNSVKNSIKNPSTKQTETAIMEKQIFRLKQENNNLKSTMTYNPSIGNFNIESKTRLKTELNQLYTKAKHYEQIFAKERGQGQVQDFKGSQVETLLLQGANLAQEGQRLMRVKSNPQFSISIDTAKHAANLNSRAAYGVDRSYQSPVIDQSVRGLNTNSSLSRFSPGQYERLIDNMRRAAHS